MPLISVIIPVYNRSTLIERAIRSVWTQTYQDFEIIIVDDGSTDESRAVITALAAQDHRTRYLRHELNKGAQAARNSGIRAAQGQWIAFLDSDDELLPRSLESRLQVAEQGKVKVVHSECYFLKADSDLKLFGTPPLAGHIYHQLLTRPGPLFPALLVAKDALEKIGYLDEQIVSYQEWDTTIRLARYYAFEFVSDPTFIYHFQGGMSAISKNLLGNGVGYEQVFRKHMWEIFRHVGPQALAQHYQAAGYWYSQAGNLGAARRCRIMRFLWWPLDFRAILRLFGKSTKGINKPI